MTIKNEESTKSFSIVSLIKRRKCFIAVLVIGAVCAATIYLVESHNAEKWAKIVNDKPSLRITRRGESNLLTSNYTIVKVDGSYNVSVESSTEKGSSFLYGLSDIEIYEVIK